MAIPVLVVTPNVGFGELICQILEETGEYVLTLASDGNDALVATRAEKPAMGIVETTLEGMEISDLVTGMRQEVPDLLLLLVSPDQGGQKNAHPELSPDGVISKPVYLPDLVTKVEGIFANCGLENLHRAEKKKKVTRKAKPKEETSEVPQAPEWLQDVNSAAQYLTRLSLESSAQASLISKSTEIWAYAGELPRPAAEELARTVASYFVNGGSGDLARFIRLEETGSEYMLYATGLGGEYILATVFDAETPFSQIRAQANTLAEALSQTAPPEGGTSVPPFTSTPGIEQLTENEQPVDDLWPMLGEVPPPIPNDWMPEAVVSEERHSFLDELLEDTPVDAFSEQTVAIQRPEPTPVPTPAPQPVAQVQPQPEVQVQVTVEEPEPEPEPNLDEALEAQFADAPPVDPLAATVVSRSMREQPPAPTVASQRRAAPEDDITFEPVSSSVYNLTYACVLVPRFPNHHLTGDIANRLSDWITHLCVAFGWRLEHLSIRPDYLQWMVNVPPNTSPGYLMRTVRQHTSRRMFIEFPTLETENPSGDFWAPGYLILGSTQPPPPHLVLDFIHNIRRRQGISK